MVFWSVRGCSDNVMCYRMYTHCKKYTKYSGKNHKIYKKCFVNMGKYAIIKYRF